jgi:hypothetical protein
MEMAITSQLRRILLIGVSIASMLGAPAAWASSISAQGTITLMRDATMLEPDGRVQGVFLLKLSTTLANGCNWAWIGAADKAAQAVAIAAKIAGAQVTLWYDSTVVAPWGETDICGAIDIDLN